MNEFSPDSRFQGITPELQQIILQDAIKKFMPGAASASLIGPDSLLELMKARGIPLTRKNYLEVVGLAEPLLAIFEAEIPRGLT